jgi:hypothetical protein
MPQIGHEDLGPGVLRDSAVRIKDAEGIIHGDAKKAGEGVIQDGKERSGR